MLIFKMADDDLLLGSFEEDQQSINPFCTVTEASICEDKNGIMYDKPRKTQRLAFLSNNDDYFNNKLGNENALLPLCNGYTNRSSSEFTNLGIFEEQNDENVPLILDEDGCNSELGFVEHCHSAKKNPIDHAARKQLIIASLMCLLFMIGEFIGGYLANSLAIMTDAAHMLSDFASFLISIFAMWFATRPATQRMSFGYYRAEVLGAVVSILIIWILTGILVYMAADRIIHDEYNIDSQAMLITSGCGVAVNIFMGIVLNGICNCHTHSHLGGGHGHSHGGHNHSHGAHSHSNGGHGHSSEGHSHSTEGLGHSNGGHGHSQSHGSQSQPAKDDKKKIKNINVRAAFIHVLGDLIQSLGVLLAAYIIHYRPDYKIADPICTFLFSIVVLITTITVLRDAIHVLMEGFPKDINFNSIKEDLYSIEGVKMAHSLHIWSLTMGNYALAVHLAIAPSLEPQKILDQASQMLRKKYHITNSTIQVEKYQPAIMSTCRECLGPQK